MALKKIPLQSMVSVAYKIMTLFQRLCVCVQ